MILNYKMQSLYNNYLRRPSLRFLGKGMDRRQELVQKRKSARLSKVLSLRHIENLENFDGSQEEETDKLNPIQERDAVVHLARSGQSTKSKERSKQNTAQQKSKLERWKAEKQRKKEILMKNKKPAFVTSGVPKYSPPIFLQSIPSGSRKENKNKVPQDFKFPCKPSGKHLQKSSTLGSNAGERKGQPRPFQSNISMIKPSTRAVSFAPKNFQFTYKARIQQDANTHGEMNSNKIQEPVCARRSERIASKQCQKDSSDTFVVPREVKRGKENRVSLLNFPRVSICTHGKEDRDLMSFSPPK